LAEEDQGLDESPVDLTEVRSRRQQEAEGRQRALENRREQAFSLFLAGLSLSQIAPRLGITVRGVEELLSRSLTSRTSRSAEKYRVLENARLDRAQAAIWPKVLEGDTKAVDTFLRISQRRARLNGLDAPLDISVSVNVRHEMQAALAELERVVLGQVIPGEVISDRDSG